MNDEGSADEEPLTPFVLLDPGQRHRGVRTTHPRRIALGFDGATRPSIAWPFLGYHHRASSVGTVLSVTQASLV